MRVATDAFILRSVSTGLERQAAEALHTIDNGRLTRSNPPRFITAPFSERKNMAKYQVGYFVGSLSSTSINRELSQVLIKLAPDDLEFTEIPIGNLPLYSQDHDANYPPEATALKDAIRRSDAILFVTPEYNRSIPARSRTPSTGPPGPGARTPSTTSPPASSAHPSARSAPPSPNRACAPSSASATPAR